MEKTITRNDDKTIVQDCPQLASKNFKNFLLKKVKQITAKETTKQTYLISPISRKIEDFYKCLFLIRNMNFSSKFTDSIKYRFKWDSTCIEKFPKFFILKSQAEYCKGDYKTDISYITYISKNRRLL